MGLLAISQILSLTSKDLLEQLYSLVNDHDLDTAHTTLTYASDGDYVLVAIKARALTDDFQPGRYTNETVVRYLRENLKVLFNGTPTFFYTGEWPVTFAALKAHLFGTYGVLLENADILTPGNTTQTIADSYSFKQADYVGSQNTIELRIAPNSPRFVPHVRGGDSIYIRILDPNSADLQYIGPTRALPPATSLDR